MSDELRTGMIRDVDEPEVSMAERLEERIRSFHLDDEVALSPDDPARKRVEMHGLTTSVIARCQRALSWSLRFKMSHLG